MASVDWTFYWWLRLKESTRRPFSRHSFHSWKCKSPERTELPSTWQLHYSQSWVFKSQPYAKCLKAQLPSPPPPQKKNLQRLRSSFGVDLLSPILSCRVLSLFIFPYLHWDTLRLVKVCCQSALHTTFYHFTTIISKVLTKNIITYLIEILTFD